MKMQELARFFRSLADRVERMTPEESASVFRELTVSLRDKKGQRQQSGDADIQSRLADTNAAVIVNQLNGANDREDAYVIIDKGEFTKTELTKIARILKVNVVKTDDMARIREKIVESTVGARLNSAAIRGE